MKEATRQGLKRKVKFNSKVVDPKRIEQYIKKSKKIANEKVLLTTITPASVLPQHITYEDSQSPVLTTWTFPQHHEVPNIVVPDAAEVDEPMMLDMPSAVATPSRSRLTTPRSSLSRRSSFSSFEMTQTDLQGSNLGSSAFVFLEEVADEEDAIWGQDDLDRGCSDDLTRRCADFGNSPWLEAASRGMLTGGPGQGYADASGFGYLSSTPVAMVHQPSASTHTPPRKQPKDVLDQANHAANDFTEGIGPDGDCQATKFLNRSFHACICVGQAQEDGADRAAINGIVQEAIEDAMRIFASMISKRDGATLSVLSVLLTMLEVHGQLFQAHQILERALEVSNEQLGTEHGLSSTILWMLAVTGRRSQVSHQCSADKLEMVKIEIEDYFGVESFSALIATYNFAWAVLHEKQDFPRAADILLRLRHDCERVFGLCNLQTIITSVTLARAFFHQDRVVQAELLIKEMIGRLNQEFPRFHPYRLEALNRQAKFLEKLGKQDEAENLLWEVVTERFSILGPNNKMSTSSLEKLHQIRKTKGHDEDLKDLYRTVSAHCVKAGLDKKRQAYNFDS